jgi:hypothetical protein
MRVTNSRYRQRNKNSLQKAHPAAPRILPRRRDTAYDSSNKLRPRSRIQYAVTERSPLVIATPIEYLSL